MAKVVRQVVLLAGASFWQFNTATDDEENPVGVTHQTAKTLRTLSTCRNDSLKCKSCPGSRKTTLKSAVATTHGLESTGQPDSERRQKEPSEVLSPSVLSTNDERCELMLLRAASQAGNAYSYVMPLGSIKKFVSDPTPRPR